MITEILLVVGSGALGMGALKLKQIVRMASKDKYGAYGWLKPAIRNIGFECPKCGGDNGCSLPSNICSCDAYRNGVSHFHFKCRMCSFNCLMRTYDKL